MKSMTTPRNPNEAPRGMGPGQAARMGYNTVTRPAVVPVTTDEQAAMLIDVVPVIGSTMTAELARSIPSWSVIADGVIVWTGGYGRAKREADKRGGTLRPSETMIRVKL